MDPESRLYFTLQTALWCLAMSLLLYMTSITVLTLPLGLLACVALSRNLADDRRWSWEWKDIFAPGLMLLALWAVTMLATYSILIMLRPLESFPRLLVSAFLMGFVLCSHLQYVLRPGHAPYRLAFMHSLLNAWQAFLPLIVCLLLVLLVNYSGITAVVPLAGGPVIYLYVLANRGTLAALSRGVSAKSRRPAVP